jgi:capsular polysaccharide biosynthesis protein
MYISVQPFLNRVLRKVYPANITDHADRHLIVSPAIESDRPAAICIPGEIERAQAFHLSPEIERGRIAGGKRQEGPTIAYRIRNATVGRGAVYTRGAMETYSERSSRWALIGELNLLPECVLVASKTTELFFGDWLVEGLSLELLAKKWLPAAAFRRTNWLHEAGYRELTGLSVEQVDIAHADKLWIIDDRGINRSRAQRFQELRRIIRSRVTANFDSPNLVYLARGKLGSSRQMSNERETVNCLTCLGFEVVEPESETPLALASKLRNTSIAVCVEGSAQVHALLAMPEGSTIINIQPPQRFTAPGKDMADMAGMRYGFVVGDAGFSVDADRLRRTIDLVNAS